MESSIQIALYMFFCSINQGLLVLLLRFQFQCHPHQNRLSWHPNPRKQQREYWDEFRLPRLHRFRRKLRFPIGSGKLKRI